MAGSITGARCGWLLIVIIFEWLQSLNTLEPVEPVNQPI